tara:strand:+ start:451 stop:822 length:372 start_codon:yes stop_codon:yes gene_type:complete
MTNYDNGKIYAIISQKNNLCYVGHTIQGIKKRLGKHITDFKGYMGELNTYRNYRGSFDILIQDDYEIILLQDYPCNCKKELEKQEAKWIFKMSAIYEITNKNLPARLGYNDLEEIKDLSIPTM